MDIAELRGQALAVEDLVNLQRDTKSQITALEHQYENVEFPPDAQSEWARLRELNEYFGQRITEQQARNAYVERLAQNPAHVERIGQEIDRGSKVDSRNADIYDLTTISRDVRGEKSGQELRDRAMRAVEIARFAHTDRAEAQGKAQELLDQDDERGTIAQRMLLTGSPVYNRAFANQIMGRPLTNEEARALSLASASGGFAVPFDLDPTIIPTSNGVVNPVREISRVIQITGDEWRGVSSGAVVATYEAEATETTDNAPTLAQPTISTEKAQAFIPFSIEVGMDWPQLRAEMGRLLQDAKDTLEATKFLTGSGTNEPFGVITGATNTVNATAAGVFDLEDLYRLVAALPPRYRPRAAFMGNLAILQTIRRFDTVGSSAAIWVDSLQADNPAQLLGKPVYEASEMTAVTTVGAKFLIYGDFSRFVIVDRIGLEIELIPHLMGANRRPTGQRGLYAFWRNGSKVVDANAFRVLLGLA